MNLPPNILLPFGYLVHVREVDEKAMREANDCEVEDDTPDGCWDEETRTIFVLRSLPLRQRRYILSHEMGHALWDWQHYCLIYGAMRP